MPSQGRWEIAIHLEAGYQNYCQLTPDELLYFCNGLKMINKYLYELLQEDLYLIIALRNIQFSYAQDRSIFRQIKISIWNVYI